MANLPIIHEEIRNPEYLTHTDERPFCSDVHCPCHDVQSGQYYELICRPLLDGLMTAEEANRLYFGDNPLDYEALEDYYIRTPEPLRLDDELDRETGTHPPDCRCAWCEPYEPPYTRADQAADEATADYYDEVQRRQETQQCRDGSWW